ncbi:hypothetical protein VFPPC_17821 [Pochonia chlamydosporia 170]|uniref:Uncharacterized protein n=1 Tax=Pochonia chlamydosporia 170 TaxID=1380566 RepID=A0A219AQC4_METCM|nr:hypothetical protein VFPPC_17821 [Pochonia chlamydosporia 170]OWT42986.1 hypothetical protein VFPPC_17821 [Pochonia chlamydosporia 170]
MLIGERESQNSTPNCQLDSDYGIALMLILIPNGIGLVSLRLIGLSILILQHF